MKNFDWVSVCLSLCNTGTLCSVRTKWSGRRSTPVYCKRAGLSYLLLAVWLAIFDAANWLLVSVVVVIVVAPAVSATAVVVVVLLSLNRLMCVSLKSSRYYRSICERTLAFVCVFCSFLFVEDVNCTATCSYLACKSSKLVILKQSRVLFGLWLSRVDFEFGQYQKYVVCNLISSRAQCQKLWVCLLEKASRNAAAVLRHMGWSINVKGLLTVSLRFNNFVV